MSCCNEQLANEIHALTRELRAWRCLMFPMLPPAKPFKQTKVIDQETHGMTTFMKYETDLNPLPPAEGRNKDIAKGIFVVTADGNEVSRMDATYDLQTRQPTGPVAWEAPKGSDVTLKLAYVDDDGNETAFTEDHFGIARDTLSPDAPSAVGVTRVIEEVERD